MKTHYHRWLLVKDTGVNQYYECKICNKRKVESIGGGYQPIDEDWLKLDIIPSAKNAPIISNEVPIGVVKTYHKSGFVECVLWDKSLNKKVRLDKDKNELIEAFYIECKQCNENRQKNLYGEITNRY